MGDDLNLKYYLSDIALEGRGDSPDVCPSLSRRLLSLHNRRSALTQILGSDLISPTEP